jgi:O-Antigen ligase
VQSSALEMLSYAFIAMPYVVAVLLGLLTPVVGVLCYSNVQAGVGVVVGMFAVESLYMFVGGFTFGVSLYYTDFVLIFVLVIALLRIFFAKDCPALSRAWVVCCGVAAFSLLSGIATYGSGAGVQARPYFYFFAATVYPMTFAIDAKKVRFLLNLAVWLAVLLLCITAYRWVVYYTPIRDLLPPEGSYNNDGPIRVIRSYETLVLAQVLVAGVFFARAANASGLLVARVLSPVLLVAVLVLQHRSVWVAAAAGVLSSMFVARMRGGSAFGQSILLVFIAATIALPLFVSDKLSGVGGQITNSAGAALAEKGSAGERVNSWNEIIKNWATAGPKSVAIGQSFGADPTRYVKDEAGSTRKLTYTAHNMYVQTLFNMGLLGLGAFLWAAAYVTKGLYRICASPQGTAADQLLLVLVLMQLVYYVPYGTDYLQALIFGIAMTYVVGHPVCVEERAKRAGKGRRFLGWRSV